MATNNEDNFAKFRQSIERVGVEVENFRRKGSRLLHRNIRAICFTFQPLIH